MSVISYTLNKCQKCLKCVKVCPTGAISLQDARVKIDNHKCINCASCMDACVHLGLQAKGSTLVDLENYGYKIALVPTAIFADCESKKHVQSLMNAILSLGFDEVVDLSQYDASLYHEIAKYIEVNQQQTQLISSFCPVINRLIESKYPMLLTNIVPFENIAEVAAKDIRLRKENLTRDVGIFYLSECVAKLPLAKYPYGNMKSSIDHAIALQDIFPIITRNRKSCEEEIDVCADGLRNVSSRLFVSQLKNHNIIIADGLQKVKAALELAEFGQLKNADFLFLSCCMNGCIGGNLLWGNAFNAQVNVTNLAKTATGKAIHLHPNQLYGEACATSVNDRRSLQEKLLTFAKLNEQLEQLPGYDCGACGYPSCRSMAEEIIAGNCTLKQCRLFNTSEVHK